MDLTLTLEERGFREEVRAFLNERLPEEVRERTWTGYRLDRDAQVRWQKVLHERGWMAPGWPVEHGGTGWTPVQRYLFEEEMEAAWAPPPLPFGISMVGPVLIAFGSEEQKRRFLPRILASEDWWCQGYSEPGAGSDLASLKTRAVRDGEHYVVNGQKTWTTLAQYADWIFCLVRTSREERRQEGISFLLIDMHSPGVTVRPIRTLDGSEEINDVFFEDVRVPVENLVGEEGKGWTYAKFLLGHERTGIAGVSRSKAQLRRVREIADKEASGGRPLAEDRRFRERIAEVEVELMSLEYTVLRIVSAMNAGAAPGPEASILKIKGTEIQQAITELLMEAVGYYALPEPPGRADSNEAAIGPEHAIGLGARYFNWRKSSIYGGSNEIQRNIIAKMVLGL